MNPETKITVYLTPTEIELVEDYARAEDRSVSSVVRRWVRTGLARLRLAKDRKRDET